MICLNAQKQIRAEKLLSIREEEENVFRDRKSKTHKPSTLSVHQTTCKLGKVQLNWTWRSISGKQLVASSMATNGTTECVLGSMRVRAAAGSGERNYWIAILVGAGGRKEKGRRIYDEHVLTWWSSSMLAARQAGASWGMNWIASAELVASYSDLDLLTLARSTDDVISSCCAQSVQDKPPDGSATFNDPSLGYVRF